MELSNWPAGPSVEADPDTIAAEQPGGIANEPTIAVKVVEPQYVRLIEPEPTAAAEDSLTEGSHAKYSGRFNIFGLWPHAATDPSHVYACDGTWAFGHSGWTSAAELLQASRAAEPTAATTHSQ
ncbi:hypothetical protein ACQP1O_22495 [Nocardia sp. CA-151230]|uniref:hypothetical protein n=1 Tax=Nocardia sp. CA-151230 TaxID=3239982 RepID=UPI003D8EC670